jgi:hypothetical protein
MGENSEDIVLFDEEDPCCTQGKPQGWPHEAGQERGLTSV